MIEIFLHRLKIPVWRLRGYDTFAGEWYPLAGIFLSKRAARAARQRLQELERQPPASSSGGQDGIQDQRSWSRTRQSICASSPAKTLSRWQNREEK